MKQLSFVVTISVLALAVTLPCDAQCRSDPYSPTEVEIPVEFEFASTAFQTREMYLSLKPKLILDGSKFDPYTTTVKDGKLRIEFCLDRESIDIKTPRPNETITYPVGVMVISFGPRRLTAALRPIQWKIEGDSISPKRSTYRGQMTAVVFTGQPSPNWVNLNYATWERAKTGALLLDIGIQNFGVSNLGGEVLLDYESFESCRFDGDLTNVAVEVPVEISYQHGTIKALSSDPDYSRIIERDVTLHVNHCGSSEFRVLLGQTGALSGGEILRIRYRFNSDLIGQLIRRYGLMPAAFSVKLAVDGIFAYQVEINHQTALSIR